MLKNTLERVLGIGEIDRAYDDALKGIGNETVFQAQARFLDIGTRASHESLGCIPRRGPLIIVANHPVGFPEGLVLPALLDSYRDDLKVLSHDYFARWPAMAERMIFVNPQARGEGRRNNRRAIVAATRWLRQGNSLLVFPAGEVARFQWGKGRIAEVSWKNGLTHLVKASGASVLPIHVSGRAGWAYQLLSLLHKRLGVLALGRELLAWRGHAVTLRIGKPLLNDELTCGRTQGELLATVWRVIEELGSDCSGQPMSCRTSCRFGLGDCL
ncbi:hypothetical protein DRQ50_01440 [bacterium]|nr:MAG: hypothetical protein DRQ50_01440 [bacterium]RKZ69036.1 MAG: hypothetical protein DRQ48_08205 [Gammaproteobacteria bacterium]